MATTETPRVWIADLAAYNDGRLVGEWVDATDPDALAAAVDKYGHHGRSDWAIFDHEGFHGWTPGESADLDTVQLVAETLADNDPDAVAAFFDVVGPYPGELADMVGRYVGDFDSWSDFAMSDHNTYTVDGVTYVGTPLGPMHVRGTDAYVDWDAIGRDFHLDGCAYVGSERGGRLHVFTV